MDDGDSRRLSASGSMAEDEASDDDSE
jgi:hypothetical protein